MFKNDPKPYLYFPPMNLFGGIAFRFKTSDVESTVTGLHSVLEEVLSSLEQAYELRSIIREEKGLFLSIRPLDSLLIDSCEDYPARFSGNRRGVRNLLLERIKKAGLGNATSIILKDGSSRHVYYTYVLDDAFNKNSVESFLNTLQAYLINLSRCKGEIKSNVIHNSVLVCKTKVWEDTALKYSYI